MTNRTTNQHRYGIIDTLRFRIMRSGCLSIIAVGILLALPLGCINTTSYLGPADAEINEAQAYADSLPANHPDKDSAVSRVAQLRANRRVAQERVDMVTTLANAALPGAGVALSLIYAAMQRARSGKEEKEKSAKDKALKVTMAVIDEISERGADIKPGELIEKLKTAHNNGGVRDVIRTTLGELHKKV